MSALIAGPKAGTSCETATSHGVFGVTRSTTATVGSGPFSVQLSMDFALLRARSSVGVRNATFCSASLLGNCSAANDDAAAHCAEAHPAPTTTLTINANQRIGSSPDSSVVTA